MTQSIQDKMEDFIKVFHYSKLNLNNPKIKATLEKYLTKIDNDAVNYSWSTIGPRLKDFFKDENCELLGRTPNQIIFWESRGWDNPTQKVLDNKNYFPTTTEYWVKKGFSQIEAKEKALNFYKDKIKGNRLLPTQLEYYTNKGQSKEEAKISLKNEQAKRVDKLVQKEKANPELRKRRLWNQIEYYTNKGYTEEVGYQLMQEKFKERNLQTMKKLTEKYISNGLSEVDALEKAQKDYKKRAKKIMKTRIDNNSFGWQKASKQSLKFFQPLMHYLDENNIEYYVGTEDKQEWFIAKGIEYFYSYDFYIPTKKLIIEYNGEHIHPNPEMSKEDWNNWKHCWTKKSADECYKLDQIKLDVARENGYKVVEVFESTTISSLDLLK